MTLTFDTSFEPSTGQLVTIAPQVARLTAPNRGPYTFTGTNTYLLGATDLLVVDPGPTDERHFEALITAIDNRPLRAILLTHTHKDHSALARLLSAKTGAPLWFGGPHRLSRPRRLFEINPLAGACDWSLKPDRTLLDGEELAIGGQKIRVLATPGHCANHLAFVLPESASILTGDHVMGWSSTLVAVPDGSMADYLTSLDRLARLPEKTYLPGHGGPIAAGPQFAAGLKAHRLSRDAQILEILALKTAQPGQSFSIKSIQISVRPCALPLP